MTTFSPASGRLDHSMYLLRKKNTQWDVSEVDPKQHGKVSNQGIDLAFDKQDRLILAYREVRPNDSQYAGNSIIAHEQADGSWKNEMYAIGGNRGLMPKMMLNPDRTVQSVVYQDMEGVLHENQRARAER